MKHLGGAPLTVLLGAGLALAVPLVGAKWVDSSVASLVPVLQSVGPPAGLLVLVLVVSAALTRRWRFTVAAGALLAVCVTIAVPSLVPPRCRRAVTTSWS